VATTLLDVVVVDVPLLAECLSSLVEGSRSPSLEAVGAWGFGRSRYCFLAEQKVSAHLSTRLNHLAMDAMQSRADEKRRDLLELNS